MEREPIPILTTPPADDIQPLLDSATKIKDNNEDKNSGILLRTFSKILPDSISNMKDSDNLNRQF